MPREDMLSARVRPEPFHRIGAASEAQTTATGSQFMDFFEFDSGRTQVAPPRWQHENVRRLRPSTKRDDPPAGRAELRCMVAPIRS